MKKIKNKYTVQNEKKYKKNNYVAKSNQIGQLINFLFIFSWLKTLIDITMNNFKQSI